MGMELLPVFLPSNPVWNSASMSSLSLTSRSRGMTNVLSSCCTSAGSGTSFSAILLCGAGVRGGLKGAALAHNPENVKRSVWGLKFGGIGQKRRVCSVRFGHETPGKECDGAGAGADRRGRRWKATRISKTPPRRPSASPRCFFRPSRCARRSCGGGGGKVRTGRPAAPRNPLTLARAPPPQARRPAGSSSRAKRGRAETKPGRLSKQNHNFLASPSGKPTKTCAFRRVFPRACVEAGQKRGSLG